jgi:hypothetical protein
MTSSTWYFALGLGHATVLRFITALHARARGARASAGAETGIFPNVFLVGDDA